MAVLYVKEQGALVRKMGERLQVTKGSQILLDVPVFQIENLAVIGNVQLTTQVLHMLMEHGTDVSYFSYSGKYMGQIGAESSKNIFLRFEQYKIFLNNEKRLKMARVIVKNKTGNQVSLIRNRRWGENETEWKDAALRIEKLAGSLGEKKTANEILGIEGICSNIYLSIFGKMLTKVDSFKGRNRRPPKDPVNVILSLAYTFLTKEMCGILEAESFETYLGFLHGIRYGRKSLALDIIEEFRQPVVDRLVLLLFNKLMIDNNDFEFSENRVVLREDGFKKFCFEYERWITGKNSLAKENFRVMMRKQVAKLKKAIQEDGTYEPYSWSG